MEEKEGKVDVKILLEELGFVDFFFFLSFLVPTSTTLGFRYYRRDSEIRELFCILCLDFAFAVKI